MRTRMSGGWVVGHREGRHRLDAAHEVVFEGDEIVYVGPKFEGRGDYFGMELGALLKVRPGELTYGSGGVGTQAHMAGELFKMLTGVNIVHVPYKGGAPAITDLIAGHVQVAWNNLPESMPHIKAGRLRALGITTATRYPGLPDLPTIDEAGVPGYEVSAWFGVVLPAKTPREVVARLNTDINRAVALPDMRERFEQQGAVPSSGTPEQFGAFIDGEIAKWAKVVKTTGVKVE